MIAPCRATLDTTVNSSDRKAIAATITATVLACIPDARHDVMNRPARAAVAGSQITAGAHQATTTDAPTRRGNTQLGPSRSTSGGSAHGTVAASSIATASSPVAIPRRSPARRQLVANTIPQPATTAGTIR